MLASQLNNTDIKYRVVFIKRETEFQTENFMTCLTYVNNDCRLMAVVNVKHAVAVGTDCFRAVYITAH